MSKLVRDKIPERLTAKGINYTVFPSDESSRLCWLALKIKEEDVEVYNALLSDDGDLEEELADVLEVIYAIADAEGISFGDIQQTRISKKRQKGGFSKNIVLMAIEGDAVG